jgi:hypothetical protein
MATYVDPVVSIQTGNLSASGTLYTCPAGKFAKVNIRFTATTGTNSLSIDGAKVIDENATVRSTTVYMNAGQTLVFTESDGFASYTAFEYAAP